MAYPARSNFQLADAQSAWVLLDATSVGATQGRTFVRSLQRVLRDAPEARAADLAVDGVWGASTQAALVAWAQAHGAVDPDLAALRNVPATGAIDARSLAWAALAVFGGAVDPARVGVPADALPPAYGIAPPDDGGFADTTVVYAAATANPGVPSATGAQAAPSAAPDPTAAAPDPTAVAFGAVVAVLLAWRVLRGGL